MKRTHEAEKQIASAAPQENSAVVKAPSCPAAFAAWWTEYRSKLTKPESGDRACAKKDGLQ